MKPHLVSRTFTVILVLGISAAAWAEESSGYRDTIDLDDSDKAKCEELLAMDPMAIAEAHSLAARFVSMISLHHPVLIDSISDGRVTDHNLLYHFTAGFAIRPSKKFFYEDDIHSFFSSSDISGYEKYVKTRGFLGDPWIPSKNASKYDHEQALLEKIRFEPKRLGASDFYASLRDETKRELAWNLFTKTVNAWGHYMNHAESPRDQSRPYTWSDKFYLENDPSTKGPVLVKVRKVSPLIRKGSDELRDIYLALTLRHKGPRVGKNLDVASRACGLILEFIAAYLPDILHARDSILQNRLGDAGDYSVAVLRFMRDNEDLTKAIHSLSQGEPIVPPNYGSQPPVMAMPKLMLTWSDSSSENSLDELKKKIATVNAWENVLVQARGFMPILDRGFEHLPPKPDFNALIGLFPNVGDLESKADSMQSQLHELSEQARQHMKVLTDVRDLFAPEIGHRLDGLAYLSTDLVNPQSEVDTLEWEEALLLKANLLHANQVLRIRMAQQVKWSSLLNKLQALLRQYRQELKVDPEGASKIAAKWSQAIQNTANEESQP